MFSARAKELNINAEIHYLKAPQNIRKKRVDKRNLEKDPKIYAIEVTDAMFNFMETKFEIPNQSELKNGLSIDNS